MGASLRANCGIRMCNGRIIYDTFYIHSLWLFVYIIKQLFIIHLPYRPQPIQYWRLAPLPAILTFLIRFRATL